MVLSLYWIAWIVVPAAGYALLIWKVANKTPPDK